MDTAPRREVRVDTRRAASLGEVPSSSLASQQAQSAREVRELRRRLGHRHRNPESS